MFNVLQLTLSCLIKVDWLAIVRKKKTKERIKRHELKQHEPRNKSIVKQKLHISVKILLTILQFWEEI